LADLLQVKDEIDSESSMCRTISKSIDFIKQLLSDIEFMKKEISSINQQKTEPVAPINTNHKLVKLIEKIEQRITSEDFE